MERAAIVLLGIGEENAAQVLKHMVPKQVEEVVHAMTSLNDVTQDQIDQALEEFSKESKCHTNLAVDSGQYVKRALVSALGEEKAANIIEAASFDDSSNSGIKNLQFKTSQAVVALIRDEHPQVIAVILSYLDGAKSARVLELLPDELRRGVMRRIAKIGSVSPRAMTVLNDLVESEVKEIKSFRNMKKGGVKLAADIMTYINGDVETEILEDLTKFDESLTEKIQEHMFPFEKLIELDKRSLQVLLREASSESLVLALKGVDSETQDLFFASMSERAAEMLKDDLEAKGPTQLSKVVEGQKDVVATAQQLAKEGTIVMGGKGEELV